jgi:DNA-binding transcriptional LysR family regulator
MEHRQLLNFLALCEERNFARAAEKRHISQQGLSKSIQELEKEIGAALLDRNRRGVVLTEYGKVLENTARPYTNQHDLILETIRDMAEQRQDKVSVGIADMLVSMFMPNFVGSFVKTYPEISLLLKTFSPNICQSQVEKQKLQIGIVPGPVDAERFKPFLLRRSRLRIAVGKKHPLAGRRAIKREELKNENFIRMADDAFLQKITGDPGSMGTGVELNYGDGEFIRELLATGRYVCAYDPNSENSNAWKKEITLLDIEDMDFPAEMYLIINRSVFINRAAEIFIEYATEKLRDGGGGGVKPSAPCGTKAENLPRRKIPVR